MIWARKCTIKAQDAVHDFIFFPFCGPEQTLALDANATVVGMRNK